MKKAEDRCCTQLWGFKTGLFSRWGLKHSARWACLSYRSLDLKFFFWRGKPKKKEETALFWNQFVHFWQNCSRFCPFRKREAGLSEGGAPRIPLASARETCLASLPAVFPPLGMLVLLWCQCGWNAGGIGVLRTALGVVSLPLETAFQAQSWDPGHSLQWTSILLPNSSPVFCW